MKMLFLFFALSVSLSFSNSSYSQSTKMSFDLKNVSIRDVISEIEKNSEFIFFYEDAVLDVNKKVSLSVVDATVEEILNYVLKDTGSTYFLSDRSVYILKERVEGGVKNAVESSKEVKQQGKTIRGVVLDSNKEPIIGANVIEVGTTNGTVTDLDGRFELDVKDNATVQVTYIGFMPKTIDTKGQDNFEIVLTDDSELLDEVVVVGYGTQKKVDVTGSITSVNTKELSKVIANNAGQALQGLAAGVNVRNYGLPGNNQKISIRGVTSFGDNNPLVIVDGIEQSLSNISTNDIESIQVLKDARVAAIYGVRGSNGVILVTTKKGKSGKPTVTYSGNGGATFPLRGNVFNLLNSEEYMQVQNIGNPGNDLFINGMPDYLYRSPILSGVAFEGDPVVDPDNYFYENPNNNKNYLIQRVNKEGTDWFHEAFKRAYFQEHNLSVGGGTESSKYFFSLGYLDQNGTLVETFYKRLSARVNTEFTIGEHLKIGENLNVFYNSMLPFSTGVNYGGIASLYKLPPIIPVNDIIGNWGGTWIGPSLGSEENMVANLKRNKDKSDYDSYNIVGNVYGELKLFKDFTFRTSVGLNNWNNSNIRFNDAQAENAEKSSVPNKLTISNSFGRVITVSNTLSYKKLINDKHSLDALVGSESVSSFSRSLVGESKDFEITNDNNLLLQLANERLYPTSGKSKSALLSFFGRLDYIYDNKYMVGATIRRDGSSLFGPNSRWGTFPSASLGWRISQEDFMKDIEWISDLKLRASYGVLGSQNNVSAANQFSTFHSTIYYTAYDIAGTSNSAIVGSAKNRIGNLNTGWEEDIIRNVGVDLVAFNGALELNVDLYKKSIRGLLLTEPLPSVIAPGGFVTSPTINIGDIQNKGLDLSARYRFKVGEVNNTIGINIDTYRNKITKLPEPGYFGESNRNEVGHPTGMFYGYKIVSIFKDQDEIDVAAEQEGAQPGRFRYEDVDNDDKITPEDRQFLASPHPDFTGGLTLSSEYKGFDISAQFYGVYGNTIYNQTRMYTDFFQDGVNNNKSRVLLNAWSPENTNSMIPKIENVSSFSTNSAFNDYALEDGSYLRLKNLSLGYTFDNGSAFLKRMSINSLRISATVNNLFTITNYSGLDPDIAAGSPSAFGMDVATYPTNEKRVIFGLNVSF
ncbi:MAG: TonB-dependent receptor [Fermentimonas sp.]